MSLRVSVIFGTRPEAIKLAPVILALKTRDDLECRICVTAQHREMLDSVLDVFALRPDTDLNLMRSGQSLAGFTSRAVETLDACLAEERPDLVLVQGDTTTVFCATLAAFYHRIPVGHVEAGLRTGDLQAPWPEEANRVLTSRLASLHFAPTEAARQNLLREHVPDNTICVTGNTVIDALRYAVERIRLHPPAIPDLPPELQPSSLAESSGRRMVLITGHRRENFGVGFEQICQAIAGLAERFPDVHFVYPVHLNPNVREPVTRILGERIASRKKANGALRSRGANIHLLEPLTYLPFVALMSQAAVILTDSGGVQEEAPSLGTPVLVMRETTERPEGLGTGLVRLVGTDSQTITKQVSLFLQDRPAPQQRSWTASPYGDGHAAERIAKVCGEFLARRDAPGVRGRSAARPD